MDYDVQVEKILGAFSFDRVHRAMAALNWQWAGEGVPSIDKLKKLAENLLRDVAHEGQSKDHIVSYATGGFVAIHNPSGMLELAFEIDNRNGLNS